MQVDLTGKTALVTGSDRNTGQVIALALQEAGARMVVHSNDGDDSARSAAAELSGAVADAQQAVAVSGDIASEAGCDAVIAALAADGLEIDILVNNYGSAGPGRWETADTQDWLEMYEKNVLSAARLCRALTPGMKDRGWGRIVNLGTIGSHRPGKVMPHYYAAKGALATMGVSLMQELAGSGITVNTVSPGLIHTPDLEAAYRARAARKGWGDDWQGILAKIVETDFPNPCQRLATREEVADLVCFLCSERAGFINGQNIRIDGGALAWV